MKSKLFFMVLGLLMVLCAISFAQVPRMINYQGKLTKASGAPLDTVVQIVFSIYADPITLTSIWSETQGTVGVERGIFDVLLGNVNPIPDSVFNGSVRYLGVRVGGDPEIAPRKPMVSVAYALTAGRYYGEGLIPTGTILPFAGSLAPTGFLMADGAAVSRTTYAALYSVIGITYGSGDGLTTFNLPNLTGRVTVGRDESDTIFANLGNNGGEETHTLTIAEMPSHTHSYTTLYTYVPHGSSTSNSWASTSSATTSATGGDAPHNNLQPYLVINYILKY